MVTRWQRPGVLAAPLLVALAVGCGEAEEARDDGMTADPAVATVDFDTAPRTEPEGEAGPAVRAELEGLAGTDVVGSAVLTPRAGTTAVTVEIHAANSGWPYVAELIEGSCASPGGVVAVLGEMTAGESGDAEFHQTLDRSLLPPDGANRAVWVRGADDPIAVVACGNLGASVGGTTSTTGR
ncbi:MAG TPA: hypothetical protein VMR66_03740 [Gemmatimonadota bacterium]|nr:hypothetical protein [Gemmatimonadota bacterium]